VGTLPPLLDTRYSILDSRPVESGQLGAKTGSGFYNWEKYKAVGVNPDVARYRIK
jgi:3-hydroxyacyl-CoA dehydrogenase